MQIAVQNAYLSTWIFTILLIIIVIFSMRKKHDDGLLTLSVTQELKGFAILTVIFCHIGYFLATDSQFLFPLSIMSGVGVDIFLFLSGFGLTMSALAKNISVFGFYKKHLSKIYIPLWIILAIFFTLSFFVSHIGYSSSYILKSFTGIFTSADIYKDINSPLWFITAIVFYYLLFPIFFSKKYPWISAIIIFLCSFAIVKSNPSILAGVMNLYQVHILAFPVGMLYAWVLSQPNISTYIKHFLANLRPPIYYFFIFLIIFVIGYLAYFSGVGKGIFWQSCISMITTLAVIKLFIMKQVRINLFYVLGLYSFEIYLLHWPILYHYDVFYHYLPAWLATISYLGLFLVLGFLLKKVSDQILTIFFK